MSCSFSPSFRRTVLFETLRVAVAGIVLGGAPPWPPPIHCGLPFKASPWNAAAYAWMPLTVLAAALVSGYLPARRASRIDNMQALRSN